MAWVTNPCFSFELEDCRLAVMPSNGFHPVICDNSHWGLFLWKRDCKVLEESHNVRLSVRTCDGREKCSHSGELDAYCGFGKWDFLLVDHTLNDCVFSGRIKIDCLIERKEDPSNTVSCKHIFLFLYQ